VTPSRRPIPPSRRMPGPKPTAADVRRIKKHAVRVPIRRRGAREADPNSRPEKVHLLEIDACRVCSSLPLERNPRIQGPRARPRPERSILPLYAPLFFLKVNSRSESQSTGSAA
jgi:hypothetical protein